MGLCWQTRLPLPFLSSQRGRSTSTARGVGRRAGGDHTGTQTAVSRVFRAAACSGVFQCARVPPIAPNLLQGWWEPEQPWEAKRDGGSQRRAEELGQFGSLHRNKFSSFKIWVI